MAYASGPPSEFPTDADVANYLDPIIGREACDWIPDLGQSWNVDYSMSGTESMAQSWVVPRTSKLPLAIRQLLSWNRERFSDYNRFWDMRGSFSPPRPLVPVAARLTPMLSPKEDIGVIKGHMSAAYFACTPGFFPAIVADKYRLDLTWAADEFVNRFKVQYAKIEVEPSIRLESIHGANLGVIQYDGAGIPKKNVQAKDVNVVSIGFPLREPQMMIKVTYPWVRLDGVKPSIMNAGPLGDWWISNANAAGGPPMGQLPRGQYLGCVNSVTFLGHPAGRVLYQSAELVEKVSPVTMRIGYQITHVFLVLTNASWNSSRYQGPMDDANPAAGGGTDQVAWPYGAIVALRKDGTPFEANAGNYVYPYLQRDLNDLLYYGPPDNPVNVIDEA